MKPRSHGKTTALKRFTVDLAPEYWAKFSRIRAYLEGVKGVKYTLIDIFRLIIDIIYEKI